MTGQEGLDRLAKGAAKPVVEPAGMRVQLLASGMDGPRRVVLAPEQAKGADRVKGGEGRGGQMVRVKGKGVKMQRAPGTSHADGNGAAKHDHGKLQESTQVWPRTHDLSC